jgi:site-specific DNA-cytosine methylase
MKLSSESYSAQKRVRAYISNLPAPAPGNCAALLADCLRPGPHRISHRIFGKRTPSRNGKHHTTFQPFPLDQKSFTVTNFSDSRRDAECATLCAKGWRNIDWREAAVLQGFPTDYLFVGNPGRVSKQVAQAVQIDTGRAILRQACEVLL